MSLPTDTIPVGARWNQQDMLIVYILGSLVAHRRVDTRDNRTPRNRRWTTESRLSTTRPGDGSKRRRYPAWLIVALILAAFVGAGILGNLTMEPVAPPATAPAPR